MLTYKSEPHRKTMTNETALFMILTPPHGAYHREEDKLDMEGI